MSINNEVDVLDKEPEPSSAQSDHVPLPSEEDTHQHLSTSNPIERMVELFKNICKVSIKTDEQYLAYAGQADNSYEELDRERHDYTFILRAIPGKEPDEMLEFTALNQTGFFSKYFFIGPAKGFKYSIFQKVDMNQAFPTGLVFEKKIENPFSYKNSKSIMAKVDDQTFGEITVDNGWIYDTYYVSGGSPENAKRFSVRINKYTWQYNFRNTILCNFKGLEFPIINQDGIVVGKIYKDNPANLVKFCKGWSNIDYFTVDFPGDATPEEKILLMGLAICLDDMHISDNKRFY